jgi:hypothetical protein
MVHKITSVKSNYVHLIIYIRLFQGYKPEFSIKVYLQEGVRV